MSVKMVGFLAKFTYNLDQERSLFFLGLSSGTFETRKWPRAWLQARDGRGFAARRSRAPALPSLNLKENRDCSQSTYYQAIQTFPFIVFRLKNSKKLQDAKETSIRICFKLIHPKKGVNNLELWTTWNFEGFNSIRNWNWNQCGLCSLVCSFYETRSFSRLFPCWTQMESLLETIVVHWLAEI